MASSTREFFTQQLEAFDETRWPSGLPRKIGMKALDVIDNAASIAEKASSNPHLNEAGKAAARQEALAEHFEEVERAAATLDAIEGEADKTFAALAVPAVDKTDLHAELRDQEARSLVRAMPQEQRDRLSRLPPALAAAVIRAPAEFSGVSPSVHAMMRTEIVEATHPDKVKALRSDKHAVKLARDVLKQAASKLDEAAKFGPADRHAFMKRIKSRAAAPASNSLHSSDKIAAVRSTYATFLKS